MKQSYPFKFIYNRTPITVINDVPYFGSEREADQFTEEDILFWTTGGGLKDAGGTEALQTNTAILYT